MPISSVGKCPEGMKLEFAPEGGIFCVEPTLGIKAAPLITCPQGQRPKQYSDGSWSCLFKAEGLLGTLIKDLEEKAKNLAYEIDAMITKLGEDPANERLKADLAATAIEGEKIINSAGTRVGAGVLTLQKAIGRAYGFLETSMTNIADVVNETADDVVEAAQGAGQAAQGAGRALAEPFYKHPLFMAAALGVGVYLIMR